MVVHVNERTYPYKAWVLTPSYKTKQVLLVERYGFYRNGVDYIASETGRLYAYADLFDSELAAIQEGLRRCDKQQKRIDASLKTLEKKRSTLRKSLNEVDSDNRKETK